VSAGALSLMLLAQTWLTVDPLTLAVFHNVDIGKTAIVTTSPGTDLEVGTPSTYNRQMGYMGTAFERMLSEIGYDDKTMILVDAYYDLNDSTVISTYYQLSIRVAPDTALYYDAASGRVHTMQCDSGFLPDGLARMNLLVIPQKERISLADYRAYEKVYLVTTTWRSGFVRLQPLGELPVLSQGVAGYRFWQYEYYQLK
jgi:hypothetical protein